MPMLSLSRIVAFWAGIQPGRVAIDHEGASVTWAEFEERTNRLARAYEALGVGQDDFVTIGLPNGIEFIEAARADPAGRALPMLLLTTETAEELKVRAREAKATGWLTKPFDPDTILSLVKQLA